MYFKTEAELAEAGQEWRERLGLLEDMAKALYCAKYNLPLKYFADGGDV